MKSQFGEPSVGTVDIADLLFTPQRDFLVKNNGQKVKIDDLKGKTIVLHIVPLYEFLLLPGHTLDMIQAYNELLPLGGVEFVFVPVYIDRYAECLSSQEALFDRLFSTTPFLAVPFSDFKSCGDRIVKTIEIRHWFDGYIDRLPYWLVIDPTSRAVADGFSYPNLFKLFGGAELHPLSDQRLSSLWHEFGDSNGTRWEPRTRLINKWDQLLASPTRDYLLSRNGDRVPISSLKDKVIGLYFCENMKSPPSMEVVKKVYEEAKSRNYDFEIVQINFHYHFFNSPVFSTTDMSVQQCNEDIGWLTLPFKDPSCRKLQRIFPCHERDNDYWDEDCLVILDPRQADTNGVPFEFSGAEIFREYGIEGYPFTRQYLYEIEYGRQEKRVKLQSFFPPGLCHLIRPAGKRFDVTDASELTGKRVLVLFGEPPDYESRVLVSMLKSKYLEQRKGEAEESKFEVVYVSKDLFESDFMRSIGGMPWLVHPLSRDFERRCTEKTMKICWEMGVAAFDIDGELVGKESWRNRSDRNYKPYFPFISQDWKERIRLEVGYMCGLNSYH